MSYSTPSDVSATHVLCEQRMELHFDELNQKLNDLICKEEVNQLWKLDAESTLHSIWSKVCYQSACVSTSSQTDELFKQDDHTLVKLPIHYNETSHTLQEEEGELNHEELHNAVETIPSSSPSALVSHFNHEEQQDVVEVIPSASSSAHENEIGRQYQYQHKSDASPEKTPKRAKKSRSNPITFYMYQCTRCECKFSSKVEMSRHQRTHVKPPFKCDSCLQVFESHSGFTRHRRVCSSRPNENGSFDCPQCGKSWSTAAKLKRHISYHREKAQKKCKCIVCGRAFTYASELNIHMNTHTGATPFPCKFCLKRFATPSGRQHHVQVHHANSHQTPDAYCSQ